MKKRIHILTIRDHFKMMVEPGVKWYQYIHRWRFRGRFFVAMAALEPSSQPPATSAYQTLVCNCEGMDHYGKPIAYFVSNEAAMEWCEAENGKQPCPPKPIAPPPPFPIGTYYMLEARLYEIRQIAKLSSRSSHGLIGDRWEQPYELASGWFGGQEEELWSTWREILIARFDDRDEALAHLQRLILRK
jgi:hypothetical protein